LGGINLEEKLQERLLIFSQRLKLLRNEYDLTQQELADKLDTSKSNISFYENCEREPGFTVILKLSEIFNENVGFIMGESDERRN
jgi:transcriptional regulator with XRE-family HTH domain